MKRIGFIGLGIMGKPMSQNLLKAGYEVTVYNRSRAAMDVLASAGAKTAASPKEVAQNSDVVITIVTDTPDVQQVILGPNGVLEGARKGLTVIDMSTISPKVTRMISAELSKVGAARDEKGQWLGAQRPAELRAGVEANLRTLELDQIPVVNLRRHQDTDVALDEQVDEMTTDEPCTADDEAAHARDPPSKPRAP